MSKILANQIANYGDDSPIEIKEGLNIPTGKPLQAAGVAGTSGQVLSSTGTTIQWVSPFSGSYNDLTDRPSIPAAQVASDWNATSGVSRILNKPVVPLVPVVVTASAGTAALSYNSTNGEFTYTPPDLSSYATEAWVTGRGYLTSYTETDPVFTASVAAGITNTQVSNWTAAYNWGNHATQGYLTAEADTLQTVVARGNTTTGAVYITNKLYYSNNFADLTELGTVNATTYHGMFAHVHAEGHGYFSHAGGWTQLLDTGSSIGDTSDVDLSVAPQDGYVLKWDGATSTWKAQPDLVGSGGSGIVLSDLSVTQDPAGTPSLTYSNTTGVFTYTPPDLAGYLVSETDPVYSASPAAGILSSHISNWDTAYGWGNHATQGYLTSVSLAANNLTDVSYNTSTMSVGDILEWNGNAWNAVAPDAVDLNGETLQAITDRGATTTQLITTAGLTSNGTISLRDDDLVSMGADGDFSLKHDGTTNMISSTAHQLHIMANPTDKALLTNPATVGTGNIELYYGNVKKFETSSAGVTVTGALTAGGLTYPTTNGTSGQVLTSDGAGNVTWGAGGGGGSGANVTISDTLPAGTPAAGDLWWESDTGRLKIYYNDGDTSQWVDTNPPLADATSIGGQGTVAMRASIIPDTNAAYDIGSAEYKIRDMYVDDGSLHTNSGKALSFYDGNLTWGGDDVIMLQDLKDMMATATSFEDFKNAIMGL